MKHNDVKKLRAMEVQELLRHIDDVRRSLFSLRLNSATSHVSDVSQFKKFRRTIARGLTILHEKQSVSVINKEHANE